MDEQQRCRCYYLEVKDDLGTCYMQMATLDGQAHPVCLLRDGMVWEKAQGPCFTFDASGKMIVDYPQMSHCTTEGKR